MVKYILPHLREISKENAICIYHTSGEVMRYPVNGNVYEKPCNSIFCPKHSFFKRAEYSERISEALRLWPHKYFVTLPIGPVLPSEALWPMWYAFYRSLRYIWKNHVWDYAMFKEIQSDTLHLHGVIVSDLPINPHDIISRWLKFLGKYLKITMRPQDCCIQEIDKPIAVAKYISKDMENTKGAQVPTNKYYARLFQSSQRFFNGPTLSDNGKQTSLSNDNPVNFWGS